MHSREVRELALRVLAEQGSVTAAAREAGVSRASVLRWAEAAGAPRRPRREPVYLPLEEKVGLVRRLAAGEGADDLAAEAGVAASTVLGWRRRLRDEGVLSLMTRGEAAARAAAPGPRPVGEEALLARNAELELRVAVLEAKLEILKKTQAPTPRA